MNFLFATASLSQVRATLRRCAPNIATCIVVTLTAIVEASNGPTARSAELAPPVAAEGWLRPSVKAPAEPRWGFADGLQVGIHPPGGPRGLLRVYAPYLDHPRQRLINFIAVEPIVAGQSNRGLSELEPSRLDGVRGKRFWSDNSSDDATPRPADRPARGVIETVDGVEQLRVYILVERFANGAHVYLRLRFRADRSHEVGIATFRHGDSAPLDYAIVTATMGNFARLRRLHVADRIMTPQELWPDFVGDGFTPHARIPLEELARNEAGDVVVSATTDEADPGDAKYAPGVHQHWKYYGKKAVQSWRVANPNPRLEALVNARRVYWASRHLIPGGASFENFELTEPFREGREFFFAVVPSS